jgi:hypothetical protein
MNVNSQAHGQVALLFFVSCFIVMLLFSLVVGLSKQDVYRRWLALVGSPMLVSSLVFLYALATRNNVATALATTDAQRPAFDLVPASEWAVMVSLLLWVLVVAIYHVMHPIGTLRPIAGITRLPSFLRES